MRERAKLMGGSLAIRTASDSDAEVDPAFRRLALMRRFLLCGGKRGEAQPACGDHAKYRASKGPHHRSAEHRLAALETLRRPQRLRIVVARKGGDAGGERDPRQF